MSSTRIISSIIALTSDSELIDKLRNKLVEYERRIGSQAPEADPHATYKYRLLLTLLNEGAIDAVLEETVFATDEWFQPAAFRDALAVIVAYNAGELALLCGGTGLR